MSDLKFINYNIFLEIIFDFYLICLEIFLVFKIFKK